MPRFTPIWNAFNAGELSPLIDGRTDQEKYFAGCKKLVNFIPTTQGPATRRGGSRYMGTTRTSAQAWLATWAFNQQQSYVLEFTDHKLRFWVNRGLLLNGGVPYEVSTPWAASDLVTVEGTFALRLVQSGDIMWICHYAGAFAPYKLSRLGAVSWTLVPVAFAKGPFDDIDPDNPVTMSADAETGAVTITASGAAFTANDVGTSIYLEQQDSAGIKAWTARSAVSVGAIRRWESNVYQCVTVGSGITATGDNPPVHTEGNAWDGNLTDNSGDDFDQLGAEWLYLHSGWGTAQITGYTSPTVVSATVLTRLPQNVVLYATKRWAHSSFSADRGWPIAVTFFRQRLIYAKTITLYASVVGDPNDFSRKDGPDVTAETALLLKLAANRFDSIRWLSASGALLIGTAHGESSVQEQTTAKVFAADNVSSTPQTAYGSRLLEPILAGDATLFVQRTGRKLREFVYDASSDRYKADDLTVLSEHIIDAGVVDFDFQQEPDSIVWCPLVDGTLAAMTYNRERGVIAWVQHIIGGGGFVESVAVIPKPDNRRDDVWITVRRTINGSTVRYVEIIEDNRLAETSLDLAFYGDAGISYSGAPATVISGLGHLEGATVQVLADGSAHADKTVHGGSIALTRPASKVQIGFDSPAQLQPMRLEGGAQGGSAQTRRKSIAELWLRFKDTIGGLAGPSFDRLDPIPYLASEAKVGTKPVLFTGDKRMEFPAEYSTDGYICVQSSPMLPMTVVALIGRVEIDD